MKQLQIFVFGDSIAYGAWDKEGGWVVRLRKFLDKKQFVETEKYYFMVYNLGVSGDSTEDVLERFSFEVKQRFDEALETLVIFAVGINDSHFIKSKSVLRTSLDNFKANLQKLTMFAKEFTQNIVFVGATPVDESKTIPIPWDKDVSYTNEQIAKDNEIIQEFCKQNKIPFVPIFNDWLATNYKKFLSEDGLHPNTAGHKKIFEHVKELLLKKFLVTK